MRSLTKRMAAFAFLAAALVSAAAAQTAQSRRFSIPGHGSLLVDVPEGWQVAERPLANPPSTALRIGPASGDAFILQVTSVWLEPKKLAALTPQELEARVRKTAEEMLPQAVEKDVELVELHGKQASGYRFSLTDRSSSSDPSDYKYVTQGTVLSGPLVTIFTFLHRVPTDPAKARALELLASARYAEDVASARPDALQVRELAQGYELSVPVSRLVMVLPKSALPHAERRTSMNDHPRYFFFVDGPLNVSGWFEPAGGFHGIKPFWAEEMAAWSRNGLPPPVNTVFAKFGRWDAVLYEIALPPGTDSHVRAHWVQAGTWIDLHLSMTSDRPAAEARRRLIELLKSVEVRQKN